MKSIGATVLALFVICGCGDSQEKSAEPFDQETVIASCETMIVEFQSTLKQELMKAVAEGGLENAVAVCNIRAPMISDSFSNMAGFFIRRVSLKQRHAGFNPDSFETTVLDKFVATQSGEPQIYSELTFDSANVRHFRYMKEIKTGKLCLNCHGDPATFPEGLKKTLAEHYPIDPAVGYSVGDSRGAFSIIVTYPEAEESVAALLGRPGP
jgi:hypothetical protein